MRAARLTPLAVAGVIAGLAAVPVAFGDTTTPAPPAIAHPQFGQRIDLNVLLVSDDGKGPDTAAWKAEFKREGVPYTEVDLAGNARTLTDADLADYTGNHAYYQAVVQTTDGLAPNAATTTALNKLESTFGVRLLSDYATDASQPARHGVTYSGGATFTAGTKGTLTADGKLAFPYLKGDVAMDPNAFGYTMTPTDPAHWDTLLADASGKPYMGVYTHPEDGRQEMVTSFNANEFDMSHNVLLRHGMLNWVTRGVFIGTERNYLELQVDDLFLGDDKWEPSTHTTNYDATAAIRMDAEDVAQAVAWSKARGLRLDMAFNGAGSEQFKAASNNQDPLLKAMQDNKAAFGWINHTYEHPNMDCSTSAYITDQITRNVTWANANGFGSLVNPGELVTGEHSALANTRPGNPGTIDPPQFDTIDAVNQTGGTLAPGTYEYAVSATTAHGETPASTTQGTVAAPATGSTAPADNAVTVTWDAVCHATSYKVYRAPVTTTGTTTTTGAFSLIATVPVAAGDTATDTGAQAPRALSFTDTGVPGTPGTPPTANNATVDPYAQNPNTIAALTAAKVANVATDASKAYPDPAVAGSTASTITAGSTFVDGPAQTVPRYPTNVYYNVANQGDQLAEYNWIYLDPTVDPANGGCVPIAGVTTCNTAKATWADYVASESSIMFKHVAGNDPRPHYFHQTNLAQWNPALPETDPAQGGILYPVVDALLDRYNTAFNASMPLVQLTETEIAKELARQAKWAADLAAKRVTAYLQDGTVHVLTTTDMDVPLTGTTAGSAYGGQNSGWTTVKAGVDTTFEATDPVAADAPVITGTPVVGQTLSASTGAWTAVNAGDKVETAFQWQTDASGTWKDIPGATSSTYAIPAVDKGAHLRALVFAGDWIASVKQARTAATDAVTDPPPPVVATPTPTPTPVATPVAPPVKPVTPAKPASLKLTGLKMSPKRFAAKGTAHRKGVKTGATVSWTLNRAAAVRFTIQRSTVKRGVRTFASAGVPLKPAKAGARTLRFTGRIGAKALKPGTYRLVAQATDAAGTVSKARTLTFSVVRG
jgi:hypothetical protein